jgi:hypothetical protein
MNTILTLDIQPKALYKRLLQRYCRESSVFFSTLSYLLTVIMELYNFLFVIMSSIQNVKRINPFQTLLTDRR